MLGFSQHQISQVLVNLHRIFSTADIYNLVEIWDRGHALRILSIASNVFQDINVNNDSLVAVNGTDNYEFDDELLDEWHELLHGDELYEMIVDNMPLSRLESSALEEENASDSCDDDVMPPVVLATVENMALDHWLLISDISLFDLTVSCTGQRQIKDLKKEGQRAGQKSLAITKTEHRVVEITVGEGVGENSTASLALPLHCGKKMSDLINSSYF